MNRARSSAFAAFGALVFTAAFYAHLGSVQPEHYADRDDAVITLSHARNLVEYGFIGVGPSGERIEGFSAPLQFWVAAVVYALAPFEYHTFFKWQTLLGTIALGALFAALVWPAVVTRRKAIFAALSVAAGAQILASSTAFLWWHASGMENAYKTAGLLALLLVFDAMLRSGRISWPAALLIPVVAITRIDAIVPVAVLALAFAELWRIRHGDTRGFGFAALGVAPWLLFMLWRWRYFGQWEPNTGPAQSISVAGRLTLALLFPRNAMTQYSSWFASVGHNLFALQLLYLVPLGWWLRRNTVAINRVVLIVAGTFACLLQYVLFGPARMDIARTVTELGLYATAAVPFVWITSERFERRHLLGGLVALALTVVATMSARAHLADVGWGTRGFEAVADEFDRIAASEDIPRPLIANPDLGAVSWRKHFNVVDLGRLGSAVIPRVPAPGHYVAAVAQPDIIELHTPWACAYPDLTSSPEFRDGYVRVTPPNPGDGRCAGPTGPLAAFWVRRAIMKGSPSVERSFLEAFRRHRSVDVVQAELARCLALAGARPCGYVGRTLFRFEPELHREGTYDAIDALLARDPRLVIERAYFTSSRDPRWWQIVTGP